MNLSIELDEKLMTELFLNEQDHIDIKNMPEPSVFQAESTINMWNEFYKDKNIKTAEDFNTVKIWLKLYLKVKKCHPQLFI